MSRIARLWFLTTLAISCNSGDSNLVPATQLRVSAEVMPASISRSSASQGITIRVIAENTENRAVIVDLGVRSPYTAERFPNEGKGHGFVIRRVGSQDAVGPNAASVPGRRFVEFEPNSYHLQEFAAEIAATGGPQLDVGEYEVVPFFNKQYGPAVHLSVIP